MKKEQLIDPDGLDPDTRKIYDMDGYTMSVDLERTRKETGLTFSQDALQDYAATVATYVTTRVMRYWNERGEPPVKMNTMITVGINQQAASPAELLETALNLCQTILDVHAAVQMDTPEDKALHAKACAQFQDSIRVLGQLGSVRNG